MRDARSIFLPLSHRAKLERSTWRILSMSKLSAWVWRQHQSWEKRRLAFSTPSVYCSSPPMPVCARALDQSPINGLCLDRGVTLERHAVSRNKETFDVALQAVTCRRLMIVICLHVYVRAQRLVHTPSYEYRCFGLFVCCCFFLIPLGVCVTGSVLSATAFVSAPHKRSVAVGR